MNGTQPRHESLASVGDNRRTTGTRPCPPLCHYRPLEPRRSLRSGRSRVHGAKSLGEKSWCWEEPQGRSFYTEFSRIAPSTCSLSLPLARSLSHSNDTAFHFAHPGPTKPGSGRRGRTALPARQELRMEDAEPCPSSRAAHRRAPGGPRGALCLGKPGGVVRSKQKPSDSHSSKLTSVPSRTC